MHKNNVIEEIIELNRWRDGELAKLKINTAKVEDVLWCRMCIPMIYAHWEGYVVNSLGVLAGYLNNLKLKPGDIPTSLIVLSLGKTYRSLSGKQTFEQRIAFTDKFNNIFQNDIVFEKKIETKSNLKTGVLEELCNMYSFDFEAFEAFTADIDRLVNIRNRIAHGENSIVPTSSNVEKYVVAVVGAMDVLLNEILLFLEDEKYLLRKTA